MRSIVYILGNAVGKCTKNNTAPTCTAPSNCVSYLQCVENAASFRVLLLFPGKYGINFGPLFLVHMLYVSVTVWACFRIFSQPASRSILTVNHDQTCNYYNKEYYPLGNVHLNKPQAKHFTVLLHWNLLPCLGCLCHKYLKTAFDYDSNEHSCHHASKLNVFKSVFGTSHISSFRTSKRFNKEVYPTDLWTYSLLSTSFWLLLSASSGVW